MMMLFLIGLGLGALTMIPPGPVSVTLVQVGVSRGSTSGLRAGAGVASADLLSGVAAVAIVGVGATTLPSLTASLSVFAAMTMIAMGAVLFGRPSACEGFAAGIRRPGRTMFALTALNPATLTSWIALIAAVPLAGAISQKAMLAAGVVIASWCWHPLLGFAAGGMGNRLTPATSRRVTRFSGVMLVVLGSVLAVGAAA